MTISISRFLDLLKTGKPKRFVLEYSSSMADFIQAEAVRATCADTREY